MYGLVIRSMKEMIIDIQGEASWEEIVEKAGLENKTFIGNEAYPDEWTYSLLKEATEKMSVSAEDLLIEFGKFWVKNIAMKSYGDLIRVSAHSFQEFLVNLPNLHSRVQLVYPHLKPPDFRCSEVKKDSLRLVYESSRPGLSPFVVGILKGLAFEYSVCVDVEHISASLGERNRHEFAVSWKSGNAAL